MTDYKNLIDGEMVDNGEWLEVLNPANEQVVGRVPACGKDELDRAVAAARRAFKEWKKTPQEERQKVVQGIAAAIKGNADELYRLLTSEQGKPHTQAQQEIYGAAGLAAAQSTLTLDDVISQDDDTRLSRTRRVPVGVVGGIVPWNFPIMMAIQKIVPALVAGCTIVLKPSRREAIGRRPCCSATIGRAVHVAAVRGGEVATLGVLATHRRQPSVDDMTTPAPNVDDMPPTNFPALQATIP